MSDDAQHEHPVQGQVYFGPEGRAGLYIRTEQRPGRSGPEHLLILTADRIVLERWEDPAEFGSRWTLDYTPPVDPVEAHEARRERDALAATLKDVEGFVLAAAARLTDDRRKATEAASDVRSKMVERFREAKAAAR